MKVWPWPTSLKASGVMLDSALTQVLTAGPELAPAPSVLRVSDTPATETVVCALTVEVPVVGELMVVVHDPVPPAVVQLVGGFGAEVAPLASTVVKVMTVPSGALTKPRAVVDVGVGGEGVRLAHPVGAVGGDLEVGVDDAQRLARRRPRRCTWRHPSSGPGTPRKPGQLTVKLKAVASKVPAALERADRARVDGRRAGAGRR